MTQCLGLDALRRTTPAAVIALCLATVSPVTAQETTGQLRGQIVDAQALPVPGATVVANGAQGAREAVTDGEGRFTVPFLTPGTYDIRAELQGFKTVERNGVTVGLGQVVDLRLLLEVGELTETVVVTGSAVPLDVTSTVTGVNIDGDFARMVPVGRRVSDVTYMAPGVSSSGTAGRQNPSIAGGSGLENQYVIDGVNITNQGYGALGSYSIFHGSLGNATPFDFVKEVQVKTGGYEAEFGQSTGGVVNVVTKSGTNDIRGSGFAYARPESLEGTPRQFESENGTVQLLASSARDVGAEGSAPIVRDRIFLFGAVNRQYDTRTFQAPRDFPLVQPGGHRRERQNTSYAAKGTWQVAGGHRVDVSLFGDPSDGDMGPQRPSALLVSTTASFSAISYGGHNQTARYSGVVGSRWLVEAAYAHALNALNEVPLVDEWRFTDQTVSPQRISGGVGFYEAGNRSANHQWTFKAATVAGGHQIKYGVGYDDVTYSNRNQRSGPVFTAPDGRQTATGADIQIVPDPVFGRIYRVRRAAFDSGITTLQRYVNVFVQDSWKIGSRLTVNPGLRYEQQTLSGSVVQDFELKNNWGPRIGASFDPGGAGRSKIFANWGRFYARLPNDVAVKALSGVEQVGRADYFDPALTSPIPNGVLAGGFTNHYSILTAAAGSTADPDTGMSYVDELAVGVEQELFPNTSVSVRYIYRNTGRVLEDVGDVPMVALDLGVVDDLHTVVSNPGRRSRLVPETEFLGASFDDPVHTYHAVEAVLNRRFAGGASGVVSYRWSRLRGNFEGFYRDDNGQSDPGWTSMYDFATNDPSYTAIGGPLFGYEGDIRYLGQVGILPLDRPHQVKAYGSYGWRGVNVGVGLNLGSGKPLTPLAANSYYASGGEIPTAPRGSGIQTIDGFRTRTPFESQVDLQASYSLRFGARAVTFIADVFNLFNQQRVLDYDTWTQLASLDPNADFGKPVSQVPTTVGPQFQAPIHARVGVRVSF